jgi:hypothetical protein
VQGAVHVFQVVKENIRIRNNAFDDLPRHKARRIDGGVNALLLAAL